MAGDPPNIIIGTAFGLSFMDFLVNTGPIAWAGMILNLGIFYLVYRKSLRSGNTGNGGGGFDYGFVDSDTSSTQNGVGGSTGTNKEYTNDEALGSYPTDGALELVVDAIETVELKSGTVYTNAVRISNAGSSGRMNYYWYVQGIGLVKYAINAQSPNDGSGQLVGELLSLSR